MLDQQQEQGKREDAMKTKRMIGILGAVLLASEMALYAQQGGPEDNVPGKVPDLRNDGGQKRFPPGPPRIGAGGAPNERMAVHGGPHWGLPPMHDPESLKKAGASEQQVQALNEFMFEQQMKRIDLRAATEKSQLTVEHLMRAPSPDEKAIAQAVDAVNQANGELFKMEVAARIKMKQVLGEDVLRKLRDQGPARPLDLRGDGFGPGRPDACAIEAGAPPPP